MVLFAQRLFNEITEFVVTVCHLALAQHFHVASNVVRQKLLLKTKQIRVKQERNITQGWLSG